VVRRRLEEGLVQRRRGYDLGPDEDLAQGTPAG
jgi:hypothetical protein